MMMMSTTAIVDTHSSNDAATVNHWHHWRVMFRTSPAFLYPNWQPWLKSGVRFSSAIRQLNHTKGVERPNLSYIARASLSHEVQTTYNDRPTHSWAVVVCSWEYFQPDTTRVYCLLNSVHIFQNLYPATAALSRYASSDSTVCLWIKQICWISCICWTSFINIELILVLVWVNRWWLVALVD